MRLTKDVLHAFEEQTRTGTIALIRAYLDRCEQQPGEIEGLLTSGSSGDTSRNSSEDSPNSEGEDEDSDGEDGESQQDEDHEDGASDDEKLENIGSAAKQSWQLLEEENKMAAAGRGSPSRIIN